jgi:hypothetical protein
MITEREEEQARELFMLPGWESLMAELEDQADLCNLDACNNVEDLFFNKGRLAVIRMLLNYEDYVTRLGEEDPDYGLQ